MLAEIFYENAIRTPDHPAIIINKKIFTYGEVLYYTQILAKAFLIHKPKRIGILASRSLDAYLGILAAHWIGAAFIPLNSSFPTARLINMIKQSQLDIIFVDQKGCDRITDEKAFQVFNILSFCYSSAPLSHSLKGFLPFEINPNANAYMMFTSGSTGKPKGVPISFSNLSYFIDSIKDRYLLDTCDRVAQFSNLTFDNSILEMSLCWYYGATLIVVPEETLLAPYHFIRDNEITFWFSVPSVIRSLQKLHLLNENCFPSLKYSVFGGEALYFHLANAWQKAAKNSQIENLYGPTEVTVYCFGYSHQCQNDNNDFEIVPIGKPFPFMKAAILSDTLSPLPKGHKGQLALSGPQIGKGYWKDQKLSKKKYITLNHNGQKKIWYLTGDYCYEDPQGFFHYLGRLDNQVKIYGQRIELEEIEYHLCQITQMNCHVIVKKNDYDCEAEIIAVINEKSLRVQFNWLRTELKKYLPLYALPSKFLFIDELPLNTNGKLDRSELTHLIHKKLHTYEIF